VRGFAILATLGILAAAPRPEPKATSIHPMAGPADAEFEAVVRGTNLAGTRAVVFPGGGAAARVLGSTDTEARIAVKADIGKRTFRLITAAGVTNELAIQAESTAVHSEEQPPSTAPFLLAGRLEKRGEVDSYWIEAQAGSVMTFEATSGFGGFDPALSLWVAGRSWFDSDRLTRIAFNDEPLHFPGLDPSARLVYRFEHSGRYCLRVSAFSGQGGPDYTYRLRATVGDAPPPGLRPPLKPEWTERQFTRNMPRDWMERIARRGNAKPPKEPETYRAVEEGTADVPLMAHTGMVEGRLDRADRAHVIRMKLDEPAEVAIEVETPEATLPRFNPVVRVLQADGHEVATNVYTKRNNNGLYMMKMIQAKTVVALRAVGEYTIQIRDITNDCWSPDFAYRVLVRPRIAHIGQVQVVEDRINLEPGQSSPLTVNLDREEGFKGFAAVQVEDLPKGVTAVAGLENPVDRPPLPNAGRRERYYPVPQTATVMLMAASDAAATDAPVFARVVVRPVVDGAVGEPVLVKRIPVMVVAGRKP
jgi:hypothetical protein